MAKEDFLWRCKSWIFITVVAFASPSVWLYFLVAVPYFIWAGRRDSNPVALFMILKYAAPAVQVEVPKLFALNQGILLLLCVLLPALLRGAPPVPARGPQPPQEQSKIWFVDVLLFTFSMLQVLPYAPTESITSVLRRTMMEMLNTFLPYLAVSRILKDGRQISAAIAMYFLSCALMAPAAVFEAVKGWQLYADHAIMWGVSSNPTPYLMRAGALRAQAAAGHALNLGYITAMAFVFSLYLLRDEKSKVRYATVIIVLWAGLIAAYSRGPWITAVLAMFVYLWLLPSGSSRLIKALVGIGILGAVLYPTSLGQRVVDSLPFVGHVDSENVVYRQSLLKVALNVIPLNPWFGDILVLRNLQSLVQGEGIVDIVNGYLLIALYYGLVPLGVWVLACVIMLWRTQAGSLRLRSHDMTGSSLGSALFATMIGSLFYGWIGGFGTFFQLLMGMTVAYARWTSPGSPPPVARGSSAVRR
jgi:hypothetical protein